MSETLYKAINTSTGQILATQVKIASSFRSRSVGLLNRTSLDPQEALLIKPCNSIHTFFMKFPIDVIFLDKQGKVVKIVHNLKAWRLSEAMLTGYMVLELLGGKLQPNDVSFGQFIKFD